MKPIKLEVFNIMTTSLSSTLEVHKFPLARGAHLLRLSSVVCPPFMPIRFNALCIFLIRIYELCLFDVFVQE